MYLARHGSTGGRDFSEFLDSLLVELGVMEAGEGGKVWVGYEKDNRREEEEARRKAVEDDDGV